MPQRNEKVQQASLINFRFPICSDVPASATCICVTGDFCVFYRNHTFLNSGTRRILVVLHKSKIVGWSSRKMSDSFPIALKDYGLWSTGSFFDIPTVVAIRKSLFSPVSYTRCIPLLMSGALLATVAAGTVVSFIILKRRLIRHRRAIKEWTQSQRKYILRHTTDIQENTLSAISRELHDNINQTLTIGVLQLNHALHPAKSYDETILIVGVAKETIRTAIEDIRQLTQTLHRGLIETRSLSEAITVELNRIQAFAEITCSVDVYTHHEPDPEQRLMLFRIVQEALQNIIRHAHASEIRIQLSSDTGNYIIHIEDNGTGFTLPEHEPHQSLGLKNMHDRATMIDGQISIDSIPDHGTMMKIVVPLPSAYR